MRTSLTVLAIALGVAVVLAIDLAGTAAAGSFHSSLETLMGDNDLEITATGGIAEKVVGTLAALPYALRISPRLEDYATVINSKQTLPLIGLDLIAEANHQADESGALSITQSEDALKYVGASDSIWVGASLGSKPGDRVQLLINDCVYTFTVRGTYPDASGNAAAMVLDIGAAQRVLGRLGRVDRI
ncbi:MAG TPA: ABC transporter permease, partial [Terriglobales bacterium]|nr:ABC transporter permease [Terriglobales bacterium]